MPGPKLACRNLPAPRMATVIAIEAGTFCDAFRSGQRDRSKS